MNLYALLRARFRKPAPEPGCCAKCGKRRHLNDKINIRVWDHKNCEFPQGNPLPEPLGSMIETRELP